LAFASVPRITFTLTRAEAMAVLRLRRNWSGRAKLAMGLWFISGGALFGLLPSRLTGEPDSLWFIAVFLGILAGQFALLVAAMTVWQHRRAARLVPHPRPAEFEEWIDCIAGTEIGSTDCVYLSPELIGQVVETPTHLIILGVTGTIVVPVHAFASAADAQATAAALRDLTRRPWPFDA